ncbi:hypothetical protein JY651_32535 [Pyxidicoccus parkwayensis]|uniref:Uncharacterized protein n=1 Tax=Pyxidicoccus parkwayensis TaxID=2813578 RepID=A0ABX7NNP6_9BACT|nr:hypothetical protein [Pyxidicoccus parkwaysis]QSQ19989.1 hypothetical protein JY651_32535 [Pyxidicoccus parkwaysis]
MSAEPARARAASGAEPAARLIAGGSMQPALAPAIVVFAARRTATSIAGGPHVGC